MAVLATADELLEADWPRCRQRPFTDYGQALFVNHRNKASAAAALDFDFLPGLEDAFPIRSEHKAPRICALDKQGAPLKIEIGNDCLNLDWIAAPGFLAWQQAKLLNRGESGKRWVQWRQRFSGRERQSRASNAHPKECEDRQHSM